MSTTDHDVRTRLVEILVEVGIFGLRDEGLESAFVNGEANPALSVLGIDSLSEMELCIAIENYYNVTIIPMELEQMHTLEDVLHRITSSR
jgi:acyl carrier protein